MCEIPSLCLPILVVVLVLDCFISEVCIIEDNLQRENCTNHTQRALMHYGLAGQSSRYKEASSVFSSTSFP